MNSESEDFTSLNLGKFAAPYIAYFISEVNIIGINPGSSVDKTVKQLKNKKILYNKDRKVVQIMGGYNSSFYSSYSQPNEIAKELGNVLSCESYYLNCPAVVEQKTLREQLVKENSISKVIKFWKQIDLAIMGLGVADKRSKLFNLFNEESKKKIEKSNASGVINTSYFDENGVFVPIFEENKIGIPLENLKKIPRKVIISSGEYKSNALLGALRGGFVDILITDSLTIEAVEADIRHD